MLRTFPVLSAYTIPFLTPHGKPSTAATEVLTKLNGLSAKVSFTPVPCGTDLDETLAGVFAKHPLEAGRSLISCGLGRDACSQSTVLHAAVTAPTLLCGAVSPDYAGVFPSDLEKTSPILAVRAIAPSPAGMKIRPKDRVDIFPAQSLDAATEEEMIVESLRKVAQTINDLVKSGNHQKIFIVKKKLTRIDNLNRIFEASMEKFIHNHENVEVHVIPSSTAYNRLTMFPEKFPGIYVLNDVSNSAIFEQLLTGLAGGAGLNFTSYAGCATKDKKAFWLLNAQRGADDPFAIFLAAAKAMNALGLHSCSKKLVEKLKAVVQNDRVYPLGGTDGLGTFLKAI